jgi:surface protein
MATYIKAYLGSTPLFSSDATWTRPADWLTLPSAPSDGVKALHAVFNSSSNFAAVRCITTAGGTYTVDWGDGVVDTVASGTTINHNYVWANVSSSTITTAGYRQAIVTIAPVAGQGIASISLSEKNSTAGLQTYSTGWLDMNINVPNLINTGQRLMVGNPTTRCSYLERINITSFGNTITLASAFYNCSALRSINTAQWNTSAITSLNSTFYGCSALTTIDASTWNTSANTTLDSTFSGCSSLQEVKFAGWNTSNVTTMNRIFFNCYSLANIDVSAWNTQNNTLCTNSFVGCASLQYINIGNWNMSKVTSTTNMFNSCSNLRSIGVTTMSLPLCTNTSGMFLSCFSLASVGNINLTAVTNAANMCNACNSLKSAGFTNIKADTSFQYCQLSGSDLNTIYQNLGTGLTGKTLYVFGNYGYSASNPALAPAGWTINNTTT